MPRTLDDLIGDTANRFNAAGLVSKENNIVNLTKGTIRLLRAKTWGLNQTVYQKQRDEYIALNNGLISREDVLSGKQTKPIPFTSDIFCTYKLYLTWNPVLNTDSVIEHLLPMFEDEYERLEQYALFGKAIILGDNRHQKMLCLQGSPGSGKSALADILKSMVPNKYRTAITFSQFGAENSDYFLAQLENSLLNVGSEESHPNRKAVTLLKSVTGNDEISARPIGKEPIRFTPRVNMMFFANSKFSLGGDSSGAMNDRYLILRVNNRYRGRSHRIPFFAKYFVENFGNAFVSYCLSRSGMLGDYNDNAECIEVDSYEEVARSVLRNGNNFIEDAVDSFRKYGWKKDIDATTLKKELQRIGWSVAPKKVWNNRVMRGSLVLTPPPGFFTCEDPSMEDEENTLPENKSTTSVIDLPDILQD
jgi:energy-coupling factor transporter ATP-binding protein EcfA2